MPMFNYNNADNIQICMDVPFVDHPYLIGPRGRKCQHLMDRYRSLIHFPDSNRRQNGPKLNNVIIHGSSKNAEELRFQIRNRTPIRLAILLQNLSNPEALCARMENAIVERSLPIRLNYTENFSNAMLKTEWRNENVLVKFCEEFIGALAAATVGLDSPLAGGGESTTDMFTMALTVLPVVNPWNTMLSRQLIDYIYAVTNARVYYPSKEMFADQPPSYFIRADRVESVLQAGKYLLGLTMFQVSFVVPNNVQLNLQNALDWQRDLLVHTAIEPVFSNSSSNNNGNGKSEFLHNRAVLRSFEFCLNSVYFVRSLLLGFKKTVQSSHYSFMIDVKRIIPCSVFSEGQLYFPLYAIDDDRSFDFGTKGAEFFQKFYGGPYSLRTMMPLPRRRDERERSSFNNTAGALGGYCPTIAANDCSLGDSGLSLDTGGLMTMMMDGTAPNFHHHDVVFPPATMYGAPTPMNNLNSNNILGGGTAYKDKMVNNAFDMSMMAATLPPTVMAASNGWNAPAAGGYVYSSEDAVGGGGYSFYDVNNNSGANISSAADYYAMAGATMAAPNAWNAAAVTSYLYNNGNPMDDSAVAAVGGYGFYGCAVDANNNGATIGNIVGEMNGADYYTAMAAAAGGYQNGATGVDMITYECAKSAAVGGALSAKRKSASF